MPEEADMYSRSAESPGMTPENAFNQTYESQFVRRDDPPPESEPPAEPPSKSAGLFDKVKDIFKGFDIDDLLLIAIGVLLLLDSDEDTDVILVFIAVLLFF
jgi:hypothetical protein